MNFIKQIFCKHINKETITGEDCNCWSCDGRHKVTLKCTDCGKILEECLLYRPINR